jgi:hypothetical protein
MQRRIYMENETQTIINALDSLAVALADHHHVWTTEERALYESAIRILKNG